MIWPFQKKTEQPADVNRAEAIPVPVNETCCVHNKPIEDNVQETEPTPVADNSHVIVGPASDSIRKTAPADNLPEDDMTRDLADKIVLTQAMNILHVMKSAL